MNKIKGKSRQSNSNVETESDESNQHPPNLDLSLIRQPIATSITGFEEVLRAYEAGTNELRKLLSKECDLIYECKVCRNIFRSLTNFISHKRVYCRSSFNTSDHFHFRENGFQVPDISTIIQAEQEINNNPNGAAGILPGTDDKSKDLSGIVERLLWKQHQSRASNLNDFYDQIHTSKKSDESSSHKSHTLKLNRVNDSDIAVYQSLQVANEDSNMKDEISEVHNMLTNSNTVLGPDGKVLNLFSTPAERNGSPVPVDELGGDYTCQVCNKPCETQKMLKLHLELKHLPSTYVYQCPSCPQKFSSSAAVIKHLSNDHKKNNRRIRLMRDNIIKKRLRADEVVTKAPSINRELQKLQQANGIEVTQDDSTSWNTNDLSGDYQSDSSYTCPSCFKKFDRKAVYTNHVQACSEAKCRERTKMKKLKAKEETKRQMELEEMGSSDHSMQEISPIVSTTETSPEIDTSVNKRKRKRTSKVRKDEAEVKVEVAEEASVDWNLDDEEEKKKLENLKKEIIEDSYARAVTDPINDTKKLEDDEDNENNLIIDEKPPEPETSGNNFACQQCEKVFESDEKLKSHMNTYHSRQKRFKCKMCEYQGYRKKDTMNHLNYVHNVDADKDTLENYMESVMKAVDEESLAKQNELKKNQLKIKRRMAREKLKMNGVKDETAKDQEVKAESSKQEEKTENIEKPGKSEVKTENFEVKSQPSLLKPGKSELRRDFEVKTEKNEAKLGDFENFDVKPGNSGNLKDIERTPEKSEIKPRNSEVISQSSEVESGKNGNSKDFEVKSGKNERKSRNSEVNSQNAENNRDTKISEVKLDKNERKSRDSAVNSMNFEVKPGNSEVSKDFEVNSRSSDHKPRRSEGRSRKSEVSPNKSEVSPQKSEVSSQKSEVSPQKSDFSSENLTSKLEFKEPAPPEPEASPTKPQKMRRKSLHTSILIPPEVDSSEDSMKVPKMFIKTKVEGSESDEKKRKRKKIFKVPDVQPGQSLLNISKFGKIIKRSSTGDIKESSARPIRNRIKPVRQDFLYDLSDLLKKDADAYREQVIQATNVGVKRELRKRAMSTHTRETPGLNSFDEPLSPPPLGSPTKDEDDIPLMKFKEQRNRRMSVFQPPSRPMYPTMPRSPSYKPPAEPSPSHPNAGAAYKMALREFEASRASLYEPKFLWSICFDKEERFQSPVKVQPTTSAAASILQKLTGKVDEFPVPKPVTTTDQLIRNFDMINVSENDLDIPESRAINLNPGRNGLIALALEEAEKEGKEVCVLQECDPETSEDSDDEKPSSSSAVSDSEPKNSRKKRNSDQKLRRSRKSSDKRKSGVNNQRRLTVMQRLQENKIQHSST